MKKFKQSNEWFFSANKKCVYYQKELDIISLLNITDVGGLDEEPKCKLILQKKVDKDSNVIEVMEPDPLCEKLMYKGI